MRAKPFICYRERETYGFQWWFASFSIGQIICGWFTFLDWLFMFDFEALRLQLYKRMQAHKQTYAHKHMSANKHDRKRKAAKFERKEQKKCKFSCWACIVVIVEGFYYICAQKNVRKAINTEANRERERERNIFFIRWWIRIQFRACVRVT